MRHVVKGAIRRTSPGVWQAINDAGHRPEGIQSVELIAGSQPRSLRVNFDFTAEYVVKGCVSSDETLAAAGIVVGASVGLSSAVVKFGRNGVQIDPEAITNAMANVWLDLELGTDDTAECV